MPSKSDATTAPSLSVCCLTRGPSRRVALQLALVRDVAAEIVVAVDDRVDTTRLGPLVEVADGVVLYPYEEPVDRPVGWVHSLCRGDWILWLDDDEIVSQRLVRELPSLLRDPELTHYFLTRRWLYRDSRSLLEDPPWNPDHQLRLVRNDPALLWFPGITHWPIQAIGPHRYVDAPLYHTDLLLNPRERRREKAHRYEQHLPGKRIAGLALNHAYFLPEDRPEVGVAPLPEEDVQHVEAALGGDPWGEEAPPPRALRRASREEVDRHWHGRPPGEGLYRARLRPLEHRFAPAARETRPLLVEVWNDGTHTWPPGTLGVPEVRVSYRWFAPDGTLLVDGGLRTPFPHALRPGEAALVAADVTAPGEPGSYALELDLVHEHVRWFGVPARLAVDVAPQPLVLLTGASEPELAELAAAIAAAVPGVEPAYTGTRTGGEGYRAVPGARGYVLEGGRLSRPGTLWRAARLLLSARRLGRGGAPAVAAEFLVPLGEAALVLDLGRERGRRERLQHAVALRAARILGVPVRSVSGTAEALDAVRSSMPS